MHCRPEILALVSKWIPTLVFLIAASRSLAGTPTRDLATDRPDMTESPYTVPNGRMQLEVQLFSIGRDDKTGTESGQVMGVNLKRGLSSTLDLQLVTDLLAFEGPTVGPGETETGGGDLTIRLKWNLQGNDVDGVALALMPYVTLPTGSDAFTSDGLEAGLIVPVAFLLPSDISAGIMAEADILRDGDGSGSHLEGLATATVGRSIAGPVGGFAELTARARPRPDWRAEATLNLGTTAALGPDTQLDAGTQIGLTEVAEDWRLFLGFSIRR